MISNLVIQIFGAGQEIDSMMLNMLPKVSEMVQSRLHKQLEGKSRKTQNLQANIFLFSQLRKVFKQLLLLEVLLHQFQHPNLLQLSLQELLLQTEQYNLLYQLQNKLKKLLMDKVLIKMLLLPVWLKVDKKLQMLHNKVLRPIKI